LHIPCRRGQNNCLLRSLRLACLVGFSVLALVALGSSAANAQSCMTLQYSFQPDCYRPDASSGCVQSVTHMDLGPQIAVWLQDSNGAFVDTLMVTNATSVRGIGNRPGRWDFLSGPLFPYGKRPMSLPIWAHARGKTYDTLIMQEATCAIGGPGESCLGWHEAYSSTELYYCRPLQQGEAQADISVDVITCPTKFNSEKGKFDPTTPSYYPPRSDLTSFTPTDGTDPPTFAAINDLDTVASATPSYGAPYLGRWSVPSSLPPGDYTIMVEVNKEYDSNASHMHPDYDDGALPGYGTDGNFGQPSVVYQVPIHIDVTTGTKDAQAVSQILGYGDWTGATGVMNPRDATISTTTPGSGEARLLSISDSTSGLGGRVLASVAPCFTLVCDPGTGVCSVCDPVKQTCTPLQCVPPPAPPSTVTNLTAPPKMLTSTSATLQFANTQSNGAPVLKYDIRYQTGPAITEDQFGSAASAPQVMPGNPGSLASVSISNLKPATQYAAAVRAVDPCGQASPIASVTFTTPNMKFTQLTGCFVATAAWGSALAPDVEAMRKVRDRLRPASTMFAVATDLYYRSGPAAAELLRRSDTARALVRHLLGPVGAASKAAVALAAAHSAR
jgi:Fibronectin type III domain